MQLTSPLLYPTPYSKDFLNSTNRITLTSAAQYIGECFVVPKSGTVTKVGFLSSDGAGLTGSVSVGLYTTDSNGVPTSTAYGGMSPGTQSNPAANTAYTVTLATPATVTAGNFICAKITVATLTGGDFRLRYHPESYVDMDNGIPYLYRSDTAAFVYGMPILWVEYSDGSYVHMNGIRGEIGRTVLTFDSTTTPDLYGNKVVLPFTAKVSGLWIFWNSSNSPSGSNGEYFRIYDQSLNVLGQLVISQMHYLVAASGIYYFYFSSPITLIGKRKYYVALYEGTSVSTREWISHTFPSNAAMDVSWDKNFTLVSSVDGGAINESSTTTCVPMGLIITDIVTGANQNVSMTGGVS